MYTLSNQKNRNLHIMSPITFCLLALTTLTPYPWACVQHLGQAKANAVFQHHWPRGGMGFLDWVVDWAAKRDVYVIIDLHGGTSSWRIGGCRPRKIVSD